MENKYWSTENAHYDNSETLQDFLDNHLDSEFEVTFQDGSYAEVINKDGYHYELHASGNGDFNDHVVRFKLIRIKMKTSQNIHEKINVKNNIRNIEISAYGKCIGINHYYILLKAYNSPIIEPSKINWQNN